MRYDADEALRKTLERASALRRRSRKQREIALSAISCCCLCALLALGFAAASQGAALAEEDYGAFLLPGYVGGYVLAGVLAFALGVLVTLACLRHRTGGIPSSGQHGGPDGADAEESPERHGKR